MSTLGQFRVKGALSVTTRGETNTCGLPADRPHWVLGHGTVENSEHSQNGSREREGCGLSACLEKQVGNTHRLRRLCALRRSWPCFKLQGGLALPPTPRPVETVLVQQSPA